MWIEDGILIQVLFMESETNRNIIPDQVFGFRLLLELPEAVLPNLEREPTQKKTN